MTDPLECVIAATTQWLVSAFHSIGGAHAEMLTRQQARQAVTVAAWLRYPTKLDGALLDVVPPSGSWWLDAMPADIDLEPWRTWVDDTVASWAAALLADQRLAIRACAAVASCEHTGGLPLQFARLTHPDHLDAAAAALLRHPDLLASVADLHRDELDAVLEAAAV